MDKLFTLRYNCTVLREKEKKKIKTVKQRQVEGYINAKNTKTA